MLYKVAAVKYLSKFGEKHLWYESLFITLARIKSATLLIKDSATGVFQKKISKVFLKGYSSEQLQTTASEFHF